MKRFELRDATKEDVGTLALLECYDHPRSFFVELPPHVDPWDLPFILHEFAQRGDLTVDSHWSIRWVQSRLVPTDRQNLGEVLRENGLDAYDELRLMEMTEGRCAQDDCYLVPLRHDQTPAWYEERQAMRMADVFALDGTRLMACFCDGQVLLCDMATLLQDSPSFARILADKALFDRVSMQPGGHGACWGEALQVPLKTLREHGVSMGLVAADIAALARQTTLDTAEVAQLLDCSRQNVSDLVRRGRLIPVKTTARGPLFLRSDIYARLA